MQQIKVVAVLGAMMAAGRAGAEQPQLEVESVVIRLIEQVEAPARERGVIAEVLVREGQVVSAGDKLVRLDDTEARLELNRANFELQRAQEQVKNTAKLKLAEKTLELANVEFKRAMDAVIRYEKSVSRSERDKLKLEVDRAELQIEDAQRELQAARILVQQGENDVAIAENRIERRQIKSPIDGVVVQVDHRPGEWVEPGQQVVRIVRLDRLRAEGFLDSRHLASSLAGSKVKLEVDLPDRGETVFEGRLRFVSPEIDAIDGKARFWAEIDNGDLLLRPGLRGSLTIDQASSLRVGALRKPPAASGSDRP